MKNVLMLLGLGLIGPGCITTPTVMVDRATVRNESGMPVSNVEVLHNPTHKIGYVSSIAAGQAFDVRFESQPLLAEQATLYWTDRLGTRKAIVGLPAKSTRDTGDTDHTLIYTITPNRTVTVHLEP